MIALVEGAIRQRTPNEIALTLRALGLHPGVPDRGGAAVAHGLERRAVHDGLPGRPSPEEPGHRRADPDRPVVCLIPTTIGALLAAIGIAGMDRAMQANIIAKSGKAVELCRRHRRGAAGQDRHDHHRQPARDQVPRRSATITVPKWRAWRPWPPPPTRRPRARASSQLCENHEGDPAGRSLPRAPRRCRSRAQTRMSGVDLAGRPPDAERAPDAITRFVQGQRRQRARGPAPVGRTASRPRAPPRWWWPRAREVAGGGGPGGHPQAQHEGALRAPAEDGPEDRHDHRRQSPDRRDHRRPGRRGRLPRPGHARDEARVHPGRSRPRASWWP